MLIVNTLSSTNSRWGNQSLSWVIQYQVMQQGTFNIGIFILRWFYCTKSLVLLLNNNVAPIVFVPRTIPTDNSTMGSQPYIVKVEPVYLAVSLIRDKKERILRLFEGCKGCISPFSIIMYVNLPYVFTCVLVLFCCAPHAFFVATLDPPFILLPNRQPPPPIPTLFNLSRHPQSISSGISLRMPPPPPPGNFVYSDSVLWQF